MSASHDPDGVCDGDEPRHAKARADGYHDVVRTPEAARRLALLWEEPEPAARGRKPRFVLAEVVTAGLRVVEREGLAGLSMRQVAKELGVGTMSLYTYVPGRAELIDLMIDRAYGELDLPQSPGPWRAGLSQYALEHYRLYLTHPWILQTNMWRSPLAPNVLDAQESGLSTLIDTGLDETVVAQMVGLVDSVIQGMARAALADRMDRDTTGQGIEEYWESMSAFWVDYFDPERYPTTTRIYLAGGFDAMGDPAQDAIDQLLDTLEVLIERATTRD